MASSEEQLRQEPSSERVLFKTKTIDFLGRSFPIILQKDNGPCSLIAICNVLLMKKELNLSPDIGEISQEKLLSLIADKLKVLINNDQNEDEQNKIADAIALLPKFTSGIDVNIKFHRIDDFEFTPERAIFDLLNIPLYHGWLIDPLDHETSNAIGSKFYNSLTRDLASLDERKMEDISKDKLDEDGFDFAAAFAATLGVPSHSLLRAKYFDESSRSTTSQPKIRKGNVEEEAKLLKALKLSENELALKGEDSCEATTSSGDMRMTSHENVHMTEYTSKEQATSATRYSGEKQYDQLTSVQPGIGSVSNDFVDAPFQSESVCTSSPAKDIVHDQGVECLSTTVPDSVDGSHEQNVDENCNLNTSHADFEAASGKAQSLEAIESFTSGLGIGEPIYEGEECILDSRDAVCEIREPVYEGEMVLVEQADRGTRDVCDAIQKDEITHQQGELIDNFLKNNSSQLTLYGLFCLQEGVKENEHCVLFRNNHFSTMVKFEGELYLLVTDEGYKNQPDLVWEKLNEVNGDTLFMTSNFKEFRLESSADGTWDVQNAIASTNEYLASIDNSSQAGFNMNSDLQLAIALQQQEFEQHPQPQQSMPQQQSSGGSWTLKAGSQ